MSWSAETTRNACLPVKAVGGSQRGNVPLAHCRLPLTATTPYRWVSTLQFIYDGTSIFLARRRQFVRPLVAKKSVS